MGRRVLRLCAVLLAILTAGCTGAASPSPFHGLGRLAVLRDGHLTIIDERRDTQREVDVADVAGSLAWSADGRWLAFRQARAGKSRVMFVEASTGEVREL